MLFNLEGFNVFSFDREVSYGLLRLGLHKGGSVAASRGVFFDVLL